MTAMEAVIIATKILGSISLIFAGIILLFSVVGAFRLSNDDMRTFSIWAIALTAFGYTLLHVALGYALLR